MTNLSHVVREYEQHLSESAAMPMPTATAAGLASASSLAGSLTSTSGSKYAKLGGEMPKLGLGKGSSFVSEMIDRVVAGASPRDVAEAVMDPRTIEYWSSNVSRAGEKTGPEVLMPGAQIGLRGPTHNGHHAVVSRTDTHVTLKNDKGYEETIPISYLDSHEVVHSLETV